MPATRQVVALVTIPETLQLDLVKLAEALLLDHLVKPRRDRRKAVLQYTV